MINSRDERKDKPNKTAAKTLNKKFFLYVLAGARRSSRDRRRRERIEYLESLDKDFGIVAEASVESYGFLDRPDNTRNEILIKRLERADGLCRYTLPKAGVRSASIVF